MKSNVSDVLPPAVKRSLTKFGSDLATARRKRGLTILAVAERMGVAKNTYLRAEKGDPCLLYTSNLYPGLVLRTPNGVIAHSLSAFLRVLRTCFKQMRNGERDSESLRSGKMGELRNA